MESKATDLNLYKFKNLGLIQGLEHFITTRAGGVSVTPFDSLNLGLHVADDPSHVVRNRELLSEATGIRIDRFLYASQVHSGDVKIIDATAISGGILSENPCTDATITDMPGICLMVMVADCVPVLLCDPVKKVSAVIHAGWRGTVKSISTNTVQMMIKHFGCDPKDMQAGIGPSMGPCCYEVGEEVVDFVKQSFGTTEGFIVRPYPGSKPHFDLWYANQKQLLDNGLLPENIEISGLCTKDHNDIFFSSRADGGITGRFAGGICLKSY